MDHRGRGLDRSPLGAVPAARHPRRRLVGGSPVGLTVPARAGRWRVEVERAAASVAHHRLWPEPAVASVWIVEVEAPALVLGSTQPDAVVDWPKAAAAGVDVVRRRSGGGAVLLQPGQVLWVDVLVAAGDPRWLSDVGRAPVWLGRAWAAALARLGVAEPHVHEGGLVCGRWCRLVCFAGLGPGEVTVDGRKAVGISQRRTRAGALFQCAALASWDAPATLDLLALDDAERDEAGADLIDAATGTGCDPGRLAAALLAALRDC